MALHREALRQAFSPARRGLTLLLLGTVLASAPAAFGVPAERSLLPLALACLPAALLSALVVHAGVGLASAAAAALALGVAWAGSLGLGPFCALAAAALAGADLGLRRGADRHAAAGARAHPGQPQCREALAAGAGRRRARRGRMDAGARRRPHLAAVEAAERRRFGLAVVVAVAGARRRPCRRCSSRWSGCAAARNHARSASSASRPKTAGAGWMRSCWWSSATTTARPRA